MPEHHELLENRVDRVEAIVSAQGVGVDREKLHRAHGRRNGPNTQKVAVAVMGVGKAFHRAEQEQRCRLPCQHAEPFGHKAGEIEKIMDVVKHHQHQGDGFECRVGQPGAFCGKHTKNFHVLL